MGIQVEYNDVLALRPYDYNDDQLCINQCVPKNIVQGGQHEFLKWGYRVLPLQKSIPLVITEGKQRFSKVLGLVCIGCVCVDKDPLGDYCTTGTYRIARVFTEAESEEWLKFLNPDHPRVDWS